MGGETLPSHSLARSVDTGVGTARARVGEESGRGRGPWAAAGTRPPERQEVSFPLSPDPLLCGSTPAPREAAVHSRLPRTLPRGTDTLTNPKVAAISASLLPFMESAKGQKKI